MYNFDLMWQGAFEGEDVTHVEGDVNPVRDLEIISEELRKKVEEHEITKIIFSVHSTRGPLLLVRYGDHIIFYNQHITFFFLRMKNT